MRESYETPQFLEETTVIELAQDILDFEFSEKAAVFKVRMMRFRPRLYPSYGTFYEDVHLPVEEAGVGIIRLDFCTPEIVRIRFCVGELMPDCDIPGLKNTPMVVNEFLDPVWVEVKETEDEISLKTSSLTVVLKRKPWQMKIYPADAVLEGREVFCTRSLEMPIVKPNRVVNFDPTWNFYHRYAYPLGIARRDEDRVQVFNSFDLQHDEHIYGLGERYLALDKRGQKIHLWPEEVYNNTSSGAYKNIPFYMSTRGYGMFINTSYPVTVRIGDLSAVALSLIVDYARLLDTYFIYGPKLKDILKRYTQVTGAPKMPPKWSFGHWMARITYTSQEEVERTARELREHRIPTDVIHIDTGWFKVVNNCDLEFDPVRFPDPKGMAARLKEMGFHLCLWQTCNIPANNSLYSELKDMQGLIMREQGVPYNRPGYEDDCGMPDLSNPQVVEFLQEKYRQLFRKGVSAIKVDFGEGAPPDGVYHRFPSRAMRCLYPLLYNKMVFDVSEEFFGEGNALIWARSAWAGSQRYPLHWSGDGSATWRDLPCTLRSGLSLGLSGFVFWSHDIGGFIGNPTPELYSRWVQLAAFTSHARAHGEPPREPWYYGERAESIYRQYMELRYRLLPYIYSQAMESVRQSLPMLRALVLEFQDDPIVANIEDEYLFGDSFLVAPVMTPSNERMVYLPEGQWVNYWSKQVVQGNKWFKVEAPLEQLPLWVRAGSIIPLGPVQQFVDEKPLDPLTVELYLPMGESRFVIYDSQHSQIHIHYHQQGDVLDVEISPTVGKVELAIYGIGVRRSNVNEKLVSIVPIENGSLVCFDGQTGSRVKLFLN